MKLLLTTLCLLASYLYGSIPFALVIGKAFYNTDVRESGSHNLGGTNAGRVLGKKAGAAVIALDATKCIVTVLFARFMIHTFQLWPELFYPCAFLCIFGHCYPCFAQFKGGKGVSSAIAYTLVTNIYSFFIALATFLVTLKISKFVSLSSMLGCIAVCIGMFFVEPSMVARITNVCITVLVIYRHHANIGRIFHGEEAKVKWLK